MVASILVAGTAGFAALLLSDLCRWQRRPCLAVLCSVLGYAGVLIALVLEAASFQPAGPVFLRAAGAIVSGLFAALLVYSVLLEIPLHRRRMPGGVGTQLYTDGTYRLSRHPGLLWFISMQLSLNAVFQNGSFLVVSALLALGDLVLVFVQDIYIFPLVFPGYDAYKLRVPFLFPRLEARLRRSAMPDKVLIVDDDPAIRKVLDIGLRGAGFEVCQASAAAETLDMLRGGRFVPDCVMMDIRMPGMPGTELLGVVRKEFPFLPVVMLTALSDLETAVDSMRCGAFDYILKPARKAQVEETIRKAIRYRRLQLENERLARENRDYQHSLERKVEERTAELAEAFRMLQQANLETVKVLAETIEAKDPYTRGHCSRVRQQSARIAAELGMGKPEIEILEYGALLHDIGKIGIPERLLNKSGRLEEEEYNTFKSHAALGAAILSTVEFFRPCLVIVRHHHEWFDGRGYPEHLAGEQIGLKARVVSVADAFDAMTSSRPYRPAMPAERAWSELRAGAGTQFDPAVVKAFEEAALR